jgi:hypothetical protein
VPWVMGSAEAREFPFFGRSVSTTGRGRLRRRRRRKGSGRRGIQTARSVEDGEGAEAWMVVDGEMCAWMWEGGEAEWWRCDWGGGGCSVRGGKREKGEGEMTGVRGREGGGRAGADRRRADAPPQQECGRHSMRLTIRRGRAPIVLCGASGSVGDRKGVGPTCPRARVWFFRQNHGSDVALIGFLGVEKKTT